MRLVAFISAAALAVSGTVATVVMSGTSSGHEYVAEEFSATIWDYIVDACPEPALADEKLGDAVRGTLRATFLDDGASNFDHWLNAMRKETAAGLMNDLDKHSMAAMVVSTYGVVQQLEYNGLVVDEEHLQIPNYLEEEAEQRHEALVSLDLMECLWPTAEAIRNPQMQSGLGPIGDELWQNIGRALYTSECNMAFLLFSRTFVEADFASVPPEDRFDFWASLMRAHDHYAEPQSVASRCEDFS